MWPQYSDIPLLESTFYISWPPNILDLKWSLHQCAPTRITCLPYTPSTCFCLITLSLTLHCSCKQLPPAWWTSCLWWLRIEVIPGVILGIAHIDLLTNALAPYPCVGSFSSFWWSVWWDCPWDDNLPALICWPMPSGPYPCVGSFSSFWSTVMMRLPLGWQFAQSYPLGQITPPHVLVWAKLKWPLRWPTPHLVD